MANINTEALQIFQLYYVKNYLYSRFLWV